MEIVPMQARHLDAAAELERQCFSSPWSRGALAGELENPQAVYLVAQEEGRLLGYGGMRFAAGEYYIDNIAVFAGYRRQGVGRALVSGLIGRAQADGGAFITLEVRPSNQPAVALYAGLGFVQVGRRKNYYDKPAEDALLMTRRLKGEEV